MYCEWWECKSGVCGMYIMGTQVTCVDAFQSEAPHRKVFWTYSQLALPRYANATPWGGALWAYEGLALVGWPAGAAVACWVSTLIQVLVNLALGSS